RAAEADHELRGSTEGTGTRGVRQSVGARGSAASALSAADHRRRLRYQPAAVDGARVRGEAARGRQDRGVVPAGGRRPRILRWVYGGGERGAAAHGRLLEEVSRTLVKRQAETPALPKMQYLAQGVWT